MREAVSVCDWCYVWMQTQTQVCLMVLAPLAWYSCSLAVTDANIRLEARGCPTV